MILSEEKFINLKQAIIEGEDDVAPQLVEEILASDIDPMRIIDESIRPGLEEVGKQLLSGDMFIPDLILAGEAARVSINLITPRLKKHKIRDSKGKILLGVVHGDTHDIGKNIVKSMLIAAGFDIKDLDTNVSPELFIENIKDFQPDIVGASAYTSATAVEIGKLNDKLKEANLRDQFKLIIGGAGVYRDDTVRFGADAFGYDALEAVQVCERLMKVAKKV